MQPTPDSIQITLPLKQYLSDSVGRLDYKKVPTWLALIIQAKDPQETLCHVEIINHRNEEGEELQQLWNIADWKIAEVNYKKQKAESRVRMEAWDRRKRNIDKLVAAMLTFAPSMPLDLLQGKATEMLDKKSWTLIETIYQIKLESKP